MNVTPSQKIINGASEKAKMLSTPIPDVIYHYTSLDALNSILFNNSHPSEIGFFFTHFQNLNDPTEIVYGLENINRVIYDLMVEYNNLYAKPEGTEFHEISTVDLLDKMLNNLMVRFTDEDTAADFLKDYIKRNPRKQSGHNQIRTAFEKYRSSVFIGSFTTNPNNERMWCNYASGGTGVCLALDTKKMLSIFPPFGLELIQSVKYIDRTVLTESMGIYFRTIIDSIAKHQTNSGNLDELISKIPGDINNDLFTLMAFRLIEFISTIKRTNWRHEEEVRIFYPHFKTENMQEIQYRVSADDRLIPYIPLSFPKEVLLDIITGYKCSENNQRAINLMKKIKGI